jgi:hypothetical protein
VPRHSVTAPIEERPTLARGERIREFLIRRLPPEKRPEATYLVNALLEAAARYDRYIRQKDDWWDYVKRNKRFNGVATKAGWLETAMLDLDILSRDDFSNKVNSKDIDALLGALAFLRKEMTELARQVQRFGRPRDLAEERWILELTDIYENAFGQKACIGPAKRRGDFFDLLQLSRPTLYPGHGKLSVRQIGRMLKRRKLP